MNVNLSKNLVQKENITPNKFSMLLSCLIVIKVNGILTVQPMKKSHGSLILV